MTRVPTSLPAQTLRWHVFTDDAPLVADALARVMTASRDAIGERGAFDIVLAGGNTPRKLYRALRHADTNWRCWHVWFGDERCAPPEGKDKITRVAVIPRQMKAILDATLGEALGEMKVESAYRPVQGIWVFALRPSQRRDPRDQFTIDGRVERWRCLLARTDPARKPQAPEPAETAG